MSSLSWTVADILTKSPVYVVTSCIMLKLMILASTAAILCTPMHSVYSKQQHG